MTEPWYKSAIVYAIDVEKFADGNGDGIGDFVGLTERVEYLSWLGVTCVWLLPFYPSPRRDNGYDVADYFQVDPRFGTLEDFDRFVHVAGEHGIRVVIDLVMDHTSDEHPWFQAARRSRTSRFRDYYLWADVPPPVSKCTAPVFPGEDDTVWTYDETAGAYYYHRFYSFQPNLQISNDEVRRQVDRFLDFWMCFGVAGFRVDAVPIMVGLDEPGFRKPRDPHGLLRDFRTLVEKRRPDGLLLGEADVTAEQVVKYFGDDDELTMLFSFLLNNYLWLSLAEERRQPLLRALDQLPTPPSSGQWVNFLRNLDELNLGWLSEEEREETLARISPDPESHIYGRGTRRRLAPLLGDDPARIKLAFSLLLSLPGTPMMVYGDELGMGDDLSLPGREAARGIMQWADAPSAGFSTASPKSLVRGVHAGGEYGYRRINVAGSRSDEGSLLHAVRRLIRARRDCPEFGLGGWHVFDTESSSLLAHRSNYRDGIVVAIHNLSGKTRTCSVDLSDQAGRRLKNLLEPGEREVSGDRLEIDLPPYGYVWYRVVGERFGGIRPCPRD